MESRIIYGQQPRMSSQKYEDYNSKWSKRFGITRILTGTLLVILQVAASSLYFLYDRVYGSGMIAWVGVWTGILVS